MIKNYFIALTTIVALLVLVSPKTMDSYAMKSDVIQHGAASSEILTLQADTYITSAFPDTSRGGSNGVFVGYGDSLGYNLQRTRTLLKFRLSEIAPPYTVQITHVTLRLYLTYVTYEFPGQRMAIEAHKITSNWDENSVTWNQSPSYETSALVTSEIDTGYGQWKEWVIPNQTAQDWLDNPGQNFGLILVSPAGEQPGRHIRNFFSSNYQGGVFAPQLVVDYQVLPTPTPTSTPTQTSTPTPTRTPTLTPTSTPSGEWAAWRVQPVPTGTPLPIGTPLPLLLPPTGAHAVLDYGNLSAGRSYTGTLAGAAQFSLNSSTQFTSTLPEASGFIIFSLLPVPEATPGAPFTLNLAIKTGPTVPPRQGQIARASYLPLMYRK